MALNPQYEDIGKGFVAQYYAMFDDPLQRPNVVNFYSVSKMKKKKKQVKEIKENYHAIKGQN